MNKALKYFCIAIYWIGLLFVVFFTRHRQFISYRKVNLVPFRQRLDELFLIYWRHHGVYNFVSNLVGNIVIFLPMPFVLRAMFPKFTYRQLFLYSVSISISIEILQFIFELGITDIDDVILNGFGALIGIMILKFLQKNSANNLFANQLREKVA